MNKIRKLLTGLIPKKQKSPAIEASSEIPVDKTQGYKVIKDTPSAALVRDDNGNEVWIKK